MAFLNKIVPLFAGSNAQLVPGKCDSEGRLFASIKPIADPDIVFFETSAPAVSTRQDIDISGVAGFYRVITFIHVSIDQASGGPSGPLRAELVGDTSGLLWSAEIFCSEDNGETVDFSESYIFTAVGEDIHLRFTGTHSGGFWYESLNIGGYRAA